MSKQDRNNLLITLPVLKTELFLSYEDMMFGGAILQQASMNWHHIIEEKNGTLSKVKNLMQLSEEFFNIKAITESIMPLLL